MEESIHDDKTHLLGDAVCNDYGTILESGSDQIIHLLDERKKKNEQAMEEKAGGFTLLFKFTTWSDMLLMFFGTLFAIVSGILPPIRALFFGGMTNVFISQARYGLTSNALVNPDPNNVTPVALTFHSTVGDVHEYKDKIFYQKQYIIEEWFEIDDPFAGFGNDTTAVKPLTATQFRFILNNYLIVYLLTGTLMMFFCFLHTYFWKLAGERIAYNIRRKYLSAILRQDVLWHDLNNDGNLSDKLADDAEKIRNDVGHKCALIVQSMSTFVAGIGVGLLVNFYLTLVIFCAMPFVIGLSALAFKFVKSAAEGEQKKYASAGSVAEEVLTNIKTVNALCGQQEDVEKYNNRLEKGANESEKENTMLAILIGLVLFVMYFVYTLGFATGSYLIQRGFSSAGSVFTVFFSVVAGTIAISQSLPYWDALGESISIMSFIDKTIERKLLIDAHAKTGRKISRLTGRIEFKNISFVHPSRPEVKVLDDFNLVVEPGQRSALFGLSDTANNAIFSLLLRFYDATAGEVFIDGIAIRDYNVRWLRRQIGLVSQTPVLFEGVSIAENIMYGAEDASLEDAIAAAKDVNAHDFICELPTGYDTIVGIATSQLSECQKRRITIARELVRNPKVLLLEEAIDSTSENIELDIMEKVMNGRTTVMAIAATRGNQLYVLPNGKFVSREEWEAQQSLYSGSVQTRLHADHSSPTVETVDDDESMEENVILPIVDSEGSQESLETEDTAQRLLDAKDENEPQRQPEIIERDITVCELIKLQLPEWPWLTLGTIACIGTGLVTPLFAMCYGVMFRVFTLTGTAFAEASTFWTNVFIEFSVFCGVVYSIQFFAMSYANTKMVARMRALVFENILRQPVGWFDLDASSPVILTNILAFNSPLIKSATGDRAGQVLSYSITGIAALVIAFFYGWKLALCIAIIVSIIMELTLKQRGICFRNPVREEESMDKANRITSESVRNIRTVQALGQERLFVELYAKHLDAPYRAGKGRAFIDAVLYGLISGLTFYKYALAFGVGGYLVEVGEMKSEDVYRVFFAFSLCISIIDSNFLFVKDDRSKARRAIRSLNFLRKRKSEIDSGSNSGAKPVITGTVQFRNVHFNYPSQPTVSVLKGLNLYVEGGKMLALVGETGCGKSTIMSLLERFYDPNEGTILVDGYDIRTINLSHLRSNIGLVTGEPILFDTSVKDNIQYGAITPCETVPFDVIIKAARSTDLHDFIMSLPERYNTRLGKNGIQLSADQKVKIALARALVRNPKILLLDEVTSALDTENEKIVQYALDEAKVGRTCIMVTHRFSTVKKADIICVVQNGRIVEQGTSEELERSKGYYFELIQRNILN